MVRRTLVLLAALGLGGCFDFKKDLQQCQQDRRCPLPDGGFYVRTEGLCAQGVCWEHPFPTAVPLGAVRVAGPNDFYVGGAGGVVVHLNGAVAEIAYLGRPVPPAVEWKPVTALATCSNGVSAMTQDRQFFVRGDAGFAVVPLEGVSRLSTAVAGWTSPEDTCVFLGTDVQTPWVAEERAGKLVSLNSPPDQPAYYRVMRSIGGSSATDLWLASDRDVFARLEDGGFDVDTVPLPDGGIPGATGICSLGGGEVFVSSTRGLRARALAWSPMGDEQPLAGVACLPSGDLMAAGAGRVRRCSFGGACVDLETPESWTRVAPAGDQTLVVSSAGDVALAPPALDALSRLSSGVREELLDLALAPSGETWAAGRKSTLLHRTDAGWTWVDAGFAATDDLFAVTVLGDGRVVVAGRNGVMRVLRPDGQVDKPKFYDPTKNPSLVQNQNLGRNILRVREARGAVWALGDRGLLMREEPSGDWLVQPGTEPGYGLLDLKEGADGTLWYTGEGALIYEAAPDAGFRSIRGPFSSYALYAIFPASTGDVWFGGRDGLLLQRHTDGQLEQHRLPTITRGPDQIRGFVEQPGDAVYAVGELSLYRYTGVGTNWEILGPLPLDVVTNAIRVVGVRDEEFWVAGGKGAILRVNRAQWLRSP